MKKLLLLLFSICCLWVSAQLPQQQLIRVHNVNTVADMNAIVSPNRGNIVYVTGISTMYYYNGVSWIAVGSLTNTWGITGNSGTNSSSNFIGTTDNQGLTFRTNNNNVWRITTRGQLEYINSEDNLAIGNASTLSSYAVSTYTAAGKNNIGIGNNVLELMNQGFQNTGIGNGTLAKLSYGFSNVAIGYQSQKVSVGGSHNVSLGSQTLLKNTSGGYNTAIGSGSMAFNENGDENVALGYHSLYSNKTVDKNVSVGNLSLLNAGVSSSNNIGLGYDAQVSVAANSNQVRIGNASIGQASIQVAWSISSDLHWKDSVETLSYGLNLIKELRPVSYLRKGVFDRKREIGFIAQELDVTLRKIGYHDQGFLTKTDSGHYEVRYNDFIGIAINAIKEQQQIIESQQKINDIQQEAIKDLQKEILAIKKECFLLKNKLKYYLYSLLKLKPIIKEILDPVL
jgi:trimeric autotransporter adhesin